MKTNSKRLVALIMLELMLLFPITHALSISNINITDVNAASARIKWFTDDVANGEVRYGLSSDLGFTSRHSTFIFEHNQLVQGLQSETQYFFEIESTNINGDSAVDNNSGQYYSFTTKDITPPEKVTGLNVATISKTTATISWQQSQASDLSHYNIYRDRTKIANATQTTFDDSDLVPGTEYIYKVSAVDASGNEGSQSDTVIANTLALDTSVPQITNLNLDIGDTSTTITWQTNENTSSIVYYGINDFESKKEISGSKTSHSVALTNLVKGNAYKFIAGSCDEDNNCINSSVLNFEAGADIKAPAINLSLPKFINKKQIDISGTTEPSSTVKLFINDLNTPTRSLDRHETTEGKFNFFNINLVKENLIKLEVTDLSGNKNESTFRVSLDTEKPIVVIDETPKTVSKRNITIVGTVDEPVIINFFLKTGKEVDIEPVAGLNATPGNGSVKLSWNASKERDFSHYILFREDIGPLEIITRKSTTKYTDTAVNKDEEYSYFIKAVNKFGTESQKSEVLTVKVTEGSTNVPEPKPVEALEIEKPVLTANASGSFSEAIKLGKDGVYKLIIEVLDRAKNRVIIERTFTVDTKPPQLKIISPPSGQLIFENYANEVDIKGETEPNARVHLFIERTPLGFLNKSLDVSGLPNKISHIPDSRLDAKCSLVLGGTQFCSEAADLSTTADSEGNFEFENVDLTSILSGGFNIRQIPGRELREEQRFEETETSTLVFIATDEAGIRSAKEHRISIGNCWSGNQSWDLIPLVEFQRPGFISPLRLSENREILQFWFNYTYIGRGTEGHIIDPNGVSVQRACRGTDFIGDDRFNISCQIMPASGNTIVNPDGTISVTTLKLNRLENMERFLQKDWKAFFDSVNNELTFPLKIKIRYKHTVDGREITETQTTCQEVTYVLDNSLIDPRDVLPDFLLFDTVDFLEDSIETINEVNEQIGKVVDFVAIGCASSFLIRLGVQVYRRFISFGAEKMFQLKNAVKIGNLIKFDVGDEDQEYCNTIAKNIKEAYGLKGRDTNSLFGLKLSYFSDKDLKRCFPSVANAWETEEFWYKSYRFTCDRILGHETPSAWTENLEDEKIFQKLQTGQTCGVDESVRGKPLRAYKCKDIVSEFGLDPQQYSLDEICFRAVTISGRELWKKSPSPTAGTNNIYEITKLDKFGAEVATSYAIKQTETQYITHRPRTCAQVCGTESGNTAIVKEKPKGWLGPGSIEPQKAGENARVTCTPANTCRALPQTAPPELQIKGKAPTKAFTQGYTADCFYNAQQKYTYAPAELASETSVSNNPDLRYECCCINVDKAPTSVYYHYRDTNLYKNDKGKKESPFVSKEDKDVAPTSFDQMQWSYRYWKEGYRTLPSVEDDKTHSKYNPNRYISGRDLPACFGQNNWFYDFNVPEGETGKLLIIDSRNQLTSTLQCANIAGIRNRLAQFNNFQSALASCLSDVRETGTSDSAACKEIFTRFVCSSIWDVINLLSNSCSPFNVGTVIEDEDDYFGVVRDGFSSITQSISDSQAELANEYGNAELNNLLGTGVGEVARKVCLGAFGYDWDFSLQNVVDAAYSQSSDTFVQATTGSREFLTVDPSSGEANFDYRASWVISAGCDIESYSVDLVCVTRDELQDNNDIRCDKINAPDGNNCDCLDAAALNEGQRSKRFFSSSGKIKQNQFIQDGESRIEPSLYRYDHLKFKIRPDRELTGSLKSACFPDGHEDGVFYFPLTDKTPVDLVGCVVEPVSGVLQCKGGVDAFSAKGLAKIESIKLNDEIPKSNKISLVLGDDLTITPTIFRTPESPSKCLAITIRKNKDDIISQSIPIDIDRTSTYGPVTLLSDIQLARISNRDIETEAVSCGGSDIKKNKCNDLIKDKKLTIEPIRKDNQGNVDFKLRFIDFDPEIGNRDKEITITEDSKDTMVDTGLNKVIGNEVDANNGLFIQKASGNVRLKITEVPLPDELTEIEYKIHVPGKGHSERWKLNISLVEPREGDISCSAAEAGTLVTYKGVKQQQEIDIIVNQKSTVVTGKPQFKFEFNEDEKYLEPGDGKEINLNVKISDDKELNQIVYSIVQTGVVGEKPINNIDNACKAKEKSKAECPIKINKDFLNTVLENGNVKAGNYKITVQAIDNDGNSNEAEAEFTVGCGPSATETTIIGECRVKDSDCTEIGNIANDGISCLTESNVVCCES